MRNELRFVESPTTGRHPLLDVELDRLLDILSTTRDPFAQVEIKRKIRAWLRRTWDSARKDP